MAKGLCIILEENRLFCWGREAGDCRGVLRAGRRARSAGTSQSSAHREEGGATSPRGCRPRKSLAPIPQGENLNVSWNYMPGTFRDTLVISPCSTKQWGVDYSRYRQGVASAERRALPKVTVGAESLGLPLRYPPVQIAVLPGKQLSPDSCPTQGTGGERELVVVHYAHRPSQTKGLAPETSSWQLLKGFPRYFSMSSAGQQLPLTFPVFIWPWAPSIFMQTLK